MMMMTCLIDLGFFFLVVAMMDLEGGGGELRDLGHCL